MEGEAEHGAVYRGTPNHKAVIGALYGDEGKGLMTDYFAAQAMKDHGACTVIRSNGGAQAGHTVQTPDGIRHVFHHFGSGTFTGATTFLSRFMIINPIEFNREWNTLVGLGWVPRISISRRAQVSLPSDMILNQMFETLRGNGRHGSCGLGIGETGNRIEKGFLSFRVSDLEAVLDDRRNGVGQSLASFVEDVRRAIHLRLDERALELADLPEEFRGYLFDEDIIERFLDEAEVMLERSIVCDETEISTAKPIIFEAAQGLGLDRDMGWFPFVTRSKTGIYNIAELCWEMGIDEIEAVYVMRVYATRHGAGPLDFEKPFGLKGYRISDETNQPNDWQGTLRFAPQNLTYISRLTYLDLVGRNNQDLRVKKSAAITCLDQVPVQVEIFHDNQMKKVHSAMGLTGFVSGTLGAATVYESYGPTRDTIKVYEATPIFEGASPRWY